jgi:enoyl-CoA hydratase/carnithine racemase
MTSRDGQPTVEVGDDRVAVITLRRPAVLNALDSASHHGIGEAITALERDESVGAVVIAGEGRAFCSGSDLAEIGQLTGQAEQDYVALDFATKNRIATSVKPVVAAIQGHCVGGGLELALACDFRVAGADAVFSLPEVTLGSLPGSGGLQRLPRLVGVGVATDWIMTGRTVSAEEAERKGLVTRLVPAGEHLAAARELAAGLAAKSPLSLRLAKVALTPEPLSDRGIVAAFQMLAGDAGHRQPSYAAATKKFAKDGGGSRNSERSTM